MITISLEEAKIKFYALFEIQYTGEGYYGGHELKGIYTSKEKAKEKLQHFYEEYGDIYENYGEFQKNYLIAKGITNEDFDTSWF